MKPRTLIVAFLVLLGLLAFIWFYEKDLPSSDRRAELEKRVFTAESEKVRAIEISRGERGLRLERAVAQEEGDGETSEWRLVEPLESRGDQGAVNALVSSLVELEKSRVLEDVSAADVGLAEPRARVELETEEDSWTLLVGSDVPATASMVVQIDGRPEILVVANGLWTDLQKEAGEWRSKEVLAMRRDEIDRLALETSAGRILLARRGDGFWIESPLVDRADEDLTDELLSSLVDLRIESFVDQPELPLTAMGLDPALGSIEIVASDEDQATRLELGGEAQEARYGRLAGQVFTWKGDLQASLQRNAEEWRDRSWTALEAYEIERVEVVAGERGFSLERSGADWTRDGEEIAYGVVSDFLYALSGAEASSLEGAGEEAIPEIEVVLFSNDREERLSLFALADGGFAGRTAGRDVTLLLPIGTVDDLRLKLEAIFDAESLATDGEEELRNEDAAAEG